MVRLIASLPGAYRLLQLFLARDLQELDGTLHLLLLVE
jgi:hypothetical protein